ncbi:MAG: serine/threonine protein kinase [Oligoflexia bacterium]|nr:serine/threonine protein kinase [Oligoflexia bacterium]
MLELKPGIEFGGRYTILNPIGAGGMGAVYVARDNSHPEFLVALKVLYPGVIKTREARERFRSEIVASYRLNHPNIVRAYEYFDQQDLQAYAMEYIDGGDLFQRMKEGPMGATEVIRIMKQVASALAAIHAEGIVHRDLKPENILMTKKGSVKVTDFGVARMKDSSTLTQAGAMVGTPKYLSPEYVETGECDHRGDIYALGVIGYEMISGASPFRSDSKVSLMVERLRTDFPPVRRVAKHCPPGLAGIIERAMAVNIHKRYQSAAELVADLELIEQGKEPLNAASAERHLSAAISSVFTARNAVRAISGAFGLRDPRPWYRRPQTIAFGSAMLALALSLVLLTANLLRFGSTSIWAVPEGSYKGVISGVLADNSQYALRLWRTNAGLFVLLGKSHCPVAPVDRSGRFSCGDLQFALSVSSIERGGASGLIEELSWGTKGRWSIAEAPER